jgi:hypothetical protein
MAEDKPTTVFAVCIGQAWLTTCTTYADAETALRNIAERPDSNLSPRLIGMLEIRQVQMPADGYIPGSVIELEEIRADLEDMRAKFETLHPTKTRRAGGKERAPSHTKLVRAYKQARASGTANRREDDIFVQRKYGPIAWQNRVDARREAGPRRKGGRPKKQ